LFIQQFAKALPQYRMIIRDDGCDRHLCHSLSLVTVLLTLFTAYESKIEKFAGADNAA
jgi:hypothetical protein